VLARALILLPAIRNESMTEPAKLQENHSPQWLSKVRIESMIRRDSDWSKTILIPLDATAQCAVQTRA